ncbi:MBL fold metallo-hydrolase [Azohydromonas caseinilytica]|uniref:3',5'-cyclic-nucleotide phosphodiesterase n=1 Tax=Azohydromonas caseinilytica TaxID=2728836 RepID=A0A848FBN4_9BURK|nr:3',5'-cyclic-nucleotide phosphodiesterase [Azohydromonas caseinilytica]NML16316.1 3',5'-cyclic-nucleotide phosphodiesterase [Azohydromonas caseinilytica]
MKIRVLGCAGALAAGSPTTSFLLDDDVLIDAGTGVGSLTLEELARIDHILLSHSHLDHVLGVPLLADSVMRLRATAGRPPIRVHALPQTLQALREHLFNNLIWPDFTRLPTPQQPVLTLEPFAVGQALALGARRVEVLSASHTVPAVGFAAFAAEGGHCWVYTGDTGPDERLWQRLAQLPVAHLVIETAFRDEDAPLAQLSRHLCPSVLAAQPLQRLPGPAQLHITHIKPGEVQAVMAQLRQLGLKARALRPGDCWQLD